MKKAISLSIGFFLFTFITNAQEDTATKANVDDRIFTQVEVMPQFPGETGALEKYILENIKYPEEAKKKGIAGTVYVSFIIDKEGGVTHSKVLRGIEELNAEAIRVITNMPRWMPGMQRGVPVNVEIIMPIKFSL